MAHKALALCRLPRDPSPIGTERPYGARPRLRSSRSWQRTQARPPSAGPSARSPRKEKALPSLAGAKARFASPLSPHPADRAASTTPAGRSTKTVSASTSNGASPPTPMPIALRFSQTVWASPSRSTSPASTDRRRASLRDGCAANPPARRSVSFGARSRRSLRGRYGLQRRTLSAVRSLDVGLRDRRSRHARDPQPAPTRGFDGFRIATGTPIRTHLVRQRLARALPLRPVYRVGSGQRFPRADP